MTQTPKVWMRRDRWEELVRGENCPLCALIQSVESSNKFTFLIARLDLSRSYLSSNQFVPGYCILVCTKHVIEPYQLTAEEQALFFGDMMRAAQTLEMVFHAVKMNYQLLGNEVPHLHAHLVPRYYGDSSPNRPIDPGAQEITLSTHDNQERVRLIQTALGIQFRHLQRKYRLGG